MVNNSFRFNIPRDNFLVVVVVVVVDVIG